MTTVVHSKGIRVGIAVAVAVLVAMALPPFHAANSCEWGGVDRIVAVGDVHGAYDRYVEILRTAEIIDNGGHWSAGKTHFVQLGDVVDRGDDSRKALDLLRRLEREAPSAGGYLHMLLGNHEAARMLGDLRLTAAGEYAAFTNAESPATREKYLRGPNLPSGTDRETLLRQTPLGLVELRQAFDQVRRELTSDLDKTRASPMTSLVARADGPLWYRGLAQEPDTFAPQVIEVLTKLGARAIIVGHTVSTTGRIASRFDGRVIQIDTGMQPAYVQGGRASALDIRDGEAIAIYVDRRDPVALPKVPSPSSP